MLEKVICAAIASITALSITTAARKVITLADISLPSVYKVSEAYELKGGALDDLFAFFG